MAEIVGTEPVCPGRRAQWIASRQAWIEGRQLRRQKRDATCCHDYGDSEIEGDRPATIKHGWPIAPIDPQVDQFQAQIGGQHAKTREQEDRLQHRIIARLHRLKRKLPETRQVEHPLDHQCAAEDRSEPQPEECQQRHGDVGKKMAEDNLAFAQSLGTGQRQPLGVAHTNDRVARDQQEPSGTGQREREYRQDHVIHVSAARANPPPTPDPYS